jgi:glycosyltransferase involved in cell wall biosynthesis
MAYGLPCAGGKTSGAVPWILDHGNAGYLFDARNVSDITKVLLQACSDADLSGKLAHAGWERCQQLFDINSVAKAYIQVYKNVLSETE